MKEKTIPGLLALLLAAPLVLGAADPVPPYYSLQLSTNRVEAEAVKNLAAVAGADRARIEKRGEFHCVRVGAWPTRGEANTALKEFQALGYQDAIVLRVVNPVAWVAAPSSPATLVPATPAKAKAEQESVQAPRAEPAPAPPSAPRSTEIPPEEYDFRAAARALDQEMQRQVRGAGLTRRDGYLYTLDAAPLLLYAARRRDQALYTELLERVRPLVWNRARDPYTRGFVLWRYKKGQAPEVSGATEALQLARGLWAGAEAFGRAQDRALALTVLEGYEKHVYELSGDWLVRKYYSFGSNTFANLSVVGNYHPDFLAEVERARSTKPASGPSLSERSYGTLERAATESGLLYPIIQPEINQTYPGLDLDVYAPNNVLPVADSCTAVESAVQGRPQLAQEFLAFAADKGHRDRNNFLYAYFNAATGEAIGRQVVGDPSYACLAQLAVALKENGTLKWLKPILQLQMQSLAAVPAIQEAPLFSAGPMLLAAEAMGAFKQ